MSPPNTRIEPAWIPLQDVIEINRSTVELTEEPFSILDQGRLEGGHQRAQNRWHYGEDDIVVLAVQLLFGISQCHGFEQGNKRTGFTAALMFLSLNGYDLAVHDSKYLGELVRRVVDGKLTQERFVEIIRPYIRRI